MVSSPNATHDSDAGIFSANGRTVVTSFGWAWGTAILTLAFYFSRSPNVGWDPVIDTIVKPRTYVLLWKIVLIPGRTRYGTVRSIVSRSPRPAGCRRAARAGPRRGGTPRLSRVRHPLDAAASADMLAWGNSGFSIDAFRPDHALSSPTACLLSALGTPAAVLRPPTVTSLDKRECRQAGRSRGRWEQATHEPLISRARLAEAALTGPSLAGWAKGRGACFAAGSAGRVRCRSEPCGRS